MGRRIAGLAWSTLLAATVPDAAAEAVARGAAVSLEWTDPERAVPPPVLRLAARETQELFGTWGVSLRATGDGLPPAELRIRVILLDKDTLGTVGPTVLGQTRTTEGFPAIWILVPNVRRAVQRPGESQTPDCLLARALSRVAVHEILHVLVPEAGHTRKGLMRPRLGAHDLVLPYVPPVNGAFSRALRALAEASTSTTALAWAAPPAEPRSR